VIVIETSAMVAIYRREPGYADYLQAIARAASASLPASCFVESMMVLARHATARQAVASFLEEQKISFALIDEKVAKLAADAFLRFGKGRGHPAQLNFGELPLLCGCQAPRCSAAL
jgi:ribonuclease VapC